jgi:hypothetical protein
MLLRWMLLRPVVEVKRSSSAKISVIHRERVQDLLGFVGRFVQILGGGLAIELVIFLDLRGRAFLLK